MAKNRRNTPKKNTRKEEVSTSKAKKQKSSKKTTSFSLKFLKNEKARQIIGVALGLFGFFLFLAIVSYLLSWKADFDKISGRSFSEIVFNKNILVHNWTGRFGAAMAHQFVSMWFGISSLLFVLFFIVSGIKLVFARTIVPVKTTLKIGLFTLIWLPLTLGFFFTKAESLILPGSYGYGGNVYLNGIIGKPGTGILLLFMAATFLILQFNMSLSKIFSKEKVDEEEKNENKIVPPGTENQPVDNPEKDDVSEEIILHDKIKEEKQDKEEESVPLEKEVQLDENKNIDFTVEVPEGNGNSSETEQTEVNGKIQENNIPEHKGLDTLFDPTDELSGFQFPSLDLLDDHGGQTAKVQKDELEANKNKIIDTLNNYSIKIDRIKATIGPTVTLYEIIPAPGIRISKIKNLEDDIALSLAALGIRIIAPIPGKGTIGIEVPNNNPEIVSMRSIISSEKFQNTKYALPIGLGKTIANETFVADLAKMPHLLMAGATGQGKSVGLNAILTSLLYKLHPSQLKFILVDPKKVELSLYNQIERHYLAKLPDSDEAIITDTRKVVRTLNSLCIEMDNRYDLLKDAQVRNIKEYNEKFVKRRLNPENGHRYMPYIVLVVDEFADLIMTAGKEVEAPIARLAQLARAIGIHLIIATQRPSVNIITGTIKANFPARIGFRVTAKVDSRTILDSGGAEQLIGRGDMLLSTGSDLIRLQCAFVDLPEVEQITSFIGSQRAFPEAYQLPEYADDEGSSEAKDFDADERDPLFEDAARLIVQDQQGSASHLQRKFRIGHNRAGRIIDQLEAAKIVGPFEGSKAREVLYKELEALEQFLRDIAQRN